MIERALEFITEHGLVVKDQSEYLRDKDWTLILGRKKRKDEHKLHIKILSSITDKMDYVLIEAGEEWSENKEISKFITKLSKQVENYIERANRYFIAEKWQDYGTEKHAMEEEDVADEKADEIDFQSDILKSLIEYKKKLSKLSVSKEVKEVLFGTYGNQVMPLILRGKIEERNPKIAEYYNKRLHKD